MQPTASTDQILLVRVRREHIVCDTYRYMWAWVRVKTPVYLDGYLYVVNTACSRHQSPIAQGCSSRMLLMPLLPPTWQMCHVHRRHANRSGLYSFILTLTSRGEASPSISSASTSAPCKSHARACRQH